MTSTDAYWELHHLLMQMEQAPSQIELKQRVIDAGLVVMFGERDRGDGRTAHYGQGKQPWDTALERGWAAAGAAFSIIRYLRRTKQPERDLEAAKVYLGWLRQLAINDIDSSLYIFRALVQSELNEAERVTLGVTPADMEL
jgi:hypothetical protein